MDSLSAPLDAAEKGLDSVDSVSDPRNSLSNPHISRADSHHSMNRLNVERAASVSESELSEDVSDEVTQVVMIQGRRTTRDELVTSLSEAHHARVNSTKDPTMKRRFLKGVLDIEKLADWLVEFEYLDEAGPDSAEAKEFQRAEAAVARAEHLSHLRDTIEDYEASQADAAAFNRAAAEWMEAADADLDRVERDLVLLCEVMEAEGGGGGADILGQRTRQPGEVLTPEQRARLVAALQTARAARAAVEEQQRVAAMAAMKAATATHCSPRRTHFEPPFLELNDIL